MIQFIRSLWKNSWQVLNFPSMFIKWVMTCITTLSYTLHMNGDDYGYFVKGRGLRQGDPLSPLIFVLVMEYLSRLYKKPSREQGSNFTLIIGKRNWYTLCLLMILLCSVQLTPEQSSSLRKLLGNSQEAQGWKQINPNPRWWWGDAELTKCKW